MNFVHTFLYYILPLLIILGILILFHELGHFIVAKLFGVKVLRFSIGLGPKIWGIRFGETEYVISAIPFGGYVKMLGEDMDDEPVPVEEEHRAFNKQPSYKRLAIVAAGPLANFFLAIILFILFYAIVGEKVLAPEVGKVKLGSPADWSGIKPKDIIIAIDDISIRRWEDIRKALQKKGCVPLDIIVLRGKDVYKIEVTPKKGKIRNIFGEEIETPILGIVASGRIEIIKLSPMKAIKKGFKKTWEITKLTCITMIKLIQRVVPIRTLGGPILIGQITGKIAQKDWRDLVPFTAVISVNLGVLNLIPIPILDGGLILFLFIELLIGRPLNQKFLEIAHKAGLVILIGLMAIVMYNDIVRILTKK